MAAAKPLPGRQAYSEPLIPGCSVAGDQDPSRFLIRGPMPRRCPECELAASRQRPSVPRPQGRRTLAPDGCAFSLSNPACCFCDVWAPGGPREWRSPCSSTLVWACSSADVSEFRLCILQPVAQTARGSIRPQYLGLLPLNSPRSSGARALTGVCATGCLMQPSALPFVISNVVRYTWLGTGTHPSGWARSPNRAPRCGDCSPSFCALLRGVQGQAAPGFGDNSRTRYGRVVRAVGPPGSGALSVDISSPSSSRPAVRCGVSGRSLGRC
jgi:hypothetical protein